MVLNLIRVHLYINPKGLWLELTLLNKLDSAFATHIKLLMHKYQSSVVFIHPSTIAVDIERLSTTLSTCSNMFCLLISLSSCIVQVRLSYWIASS